MKGFIKTDAIDGWIDKGNGITVEYGNILFDEVLGLLFQEEGVDDINWWLYEKCGRPDYKMWDKDGNEIPTETLDDLWEIVKDYRK